MKQEGLFKMKQLELISGSLRTLHFKLNHESTQVCTTLLQILPKLFLDCALKTQSEGCGGGEKAT